MVVSAFKPENRIFADMSKGLAAFWPAGATLDNFKDGRVRHTHIRLDEQKIGIFEHFDVGKTQMMFPRDTSLGADAFPEEIINCRCSLRYTKD